MKIIKCASFVINGIGDALTMAARRKTPEHVKEKLIAQKAVSEAFGYYFDIDGNIVHKVRTLGIQLEDLTKTNFVLTVDGGKSKARAIASYMILVNSNVLITDDATDIS